MATAEAEEELEAIESIYGSSVSSTRSGQGVSVRYQDPLMQLRILLPPCYPSAAEPIVSFSLQLRGSASQRELLQAEVQAVLAAQLGSTCLFQVIECARAAALGHTAARCV